MGGSASSTSAIGRAGMPNRNARSQNTRATEEKEVVSKRQPSQIKNKDLSTLSAYERLEAQLPLSVIDIREYEGRLKKLVFGKETISIRQLQFVFTKAYEDFDSLNDDCSFFYQIITSPAFKSDNNDEELNIQYLMLFGLLYCQGSIKDKTHVLYDILQDGLQETISAGDKDLKDCFTRLINMATLCIHTWSQELGEQSVKDRGVSKEFEVNDDLREKWDETVEKIQEKFLDDVFDVNSKIDRKVFISQVSSKQTFLFDPAQIRKIVLENYHN